MAVAVEGADISLRDRGPACNVVTRCGGGVLKR